MYVKFSSDRRNTATGFSCRIVGLKAEEDEVEPTTEPAPTTTTEAATTTLGPGECPGPDENYCSCGRIKENFPSWPIWPFPKPHIDDNKIVGGQEAMAHAYPWQVALTYYDYQVITIKNYNITKDTILNIIQKSSISKRLIDFYSFS